LPRNVWVLTLTSYLTDVSSEMLLNLLPLFLFNVLGVRTATIGLIEGLAETTASLLKVYAGAHSDRTGRRKPLAVFGYGLSTLVKPLLFFASSWGWVLGVRIGDRIGKGLRSAPRDALLAGSVEAGRRGMAFGLHRAGDTAGAFTGLGIAALIIWSNQAGQAELSRSTFQWVVLASVIPAALAVLLLALFAQENAIQGRKTAIVPQLHWSRLDKRYRAFLLVAILFTLGNSADAFIILRAQERGLDLLQIMGMLLTFNAVYSLLSGPAGSLSDRLGRRQLLVAGWLFYALVYLGFAFARSGGQVWLLFGFYGVYYALTEGTARAFVADLVPQSQLGSAYGLFHAGIGLAALPASVIAGLLWQGMGDWPGFGPVAPFIFGAGMAMVASLLLYRLVK
jgi:MFS family permease